MNDSARLAKGGAHAGSTCFVLVAFLLRVRSAFLRFAAFSQNLRGEKNSRLGQAAVDNQCPQTFLAGGGWSQGSPRRAGATHLCAQASASTTGELPGKAPHFAGGLPAVARVAQTLQVADIAEPRPVSFVVDDVVDIGRTHAASVPGAFAAERLAQQLVRPQLLPPLVGRIQPAPGRCLCAAPVAAWAVCVAVAIGHEGAAPRVSAWPQWLLAHGLSPPGKTKSHRQPSRDHGLVAVATSKAPRTRPSTRPNRYSRQTSFCIADTKA